MKIKNSTDYPVHFLRRMTAWCAKHVGYKPSLLRSVEFRNRTTAAYSGHAYGTRRIVVSIGPPSMFPTTPDRRPGMAMEVFADRLEGLLAVTAHEIAHLLQYKTGRIHRLGRERRTERDARWHEVAALRAFREQR